MTSNLWRTIFNVLAVVAGIAPAIFGCTVSATTTVCNAPWLTPQLGALVASGLVILNLFTKAFGQGGSIAQNLGSKAVVVVPAASAAPGNVTAAQVDVHAGASVAKT